MSTPLLEVRDLVKHFPVRAGVFRRTVGAVQAVDGVSFHVERGETLGLVGESGSGKSTTGRAILRLVDPTSGSVRFEGRELTGLSQGEMRPLRRHAQMIFQDPYASLNPRRRVAQIVAEPLAVHGLVERAGRRARVDELLELVGLEARHAERYPHEFSGGQRQRVGIARALATEPEFIVADEPISALDVSIQAQVVNLLGELKERLGLTFLLIAHDLAMVRHLSDRIAVMYLGRIVEIGRREAVFGTPRHPYTRALLSAIPRLDHRRGVGERIRLEGELPDPASPPAGCRFHPRCPFAVERCRLEDPVLREVGEGGHMAACHRVEELAGG